VKLAIHGATGRMGLTITRLVQAADDIEIVGAVCAPSDPGLNKDLGELAGVGPLGVETTADVASGLLGAEVVIDFSLPVAVPGVAAAAARGKVAIVSGTTNLDAPAQAALDKAAEAVPVLWAPNTSLGVQVLAEVVQHAVKRLGLDYDAEIVELHHRRKVDAPSGTAMRLCQAVQDARQGLTVVHGREGDVGARPAEEIAVFGVRGGDVVGDHTVYLLGPGERLELTHRATSRELFAHGAIRGARFVFGRQAGRYTVADVE
jgi:4-hydroxy-tetrahydrodipicolinate reductase